MTRRVGVPPQRTITRLVSLCPAQTSKFFADSKNDIANVPRTDNEFLGFVSNILSYDENEN
jgi:hypothetical protein